MGVSLSQYALQELELGYGAVLEPLVHHNLWLGYQDSNLEQQSQNLSCCQLHHTPLLLQASRTSGRRRVHNYSGRRPVAQIS